MGRFLLLVLILQMVGSVCVATENTETKPKDAIPEIKGIPYKVSWSSTLDPDLLTILKAESTLIKLEDKLPASRGWIVKRAEKDVGHFKKILAAHGYFSGQVDFKLFEGRRPVHVKLKVHPGPRYKISGLTLLSSDNSDLMNKQSLRLTSDVVGIKPGDFVDLAKIYESREKIKKYFQHIGYPFVEIQNPEGTIDHEKKELSIVYHVTSGFLAHIQETNVEGLTHLSAQFIKNRVLWQNGQTYDQKLVDKTKRRLIETGLLASVVITAEKVPSQNSTSSKEEDIIMRIKTTESAPRSISAGARFATSEGIGGNLSWHHNNLHGGGESLGASLKSSKKEKSAKLSYNLPDFLSPRQNLLNEISFNRERTRAYVGKTVDIGTRIQRPLTDIVTGSAGLVWETGRIRREDTTYNYHLLGVPGELKIDGSNDFLNPTQGVRTDIRITPYLGKLNTSHGMTITQGSLTGYLPFMTNELGESDCVFAGFVKGGSIFIKTVDFVPPNKRFYAGGGGSVRGYGYQLLGPVDTQSSPIGGRSLAEIGTELRFKTSETIGFVTFFEGGSVSFNETPDFRGRHMLWGTGFGVRYYSSIGPIRADIGFPLKRRKDTNGKPIDSAFQFYISIGQAF